MGTEFLRSYSASQEIPHLSRNRKVHYRVHKSVPLDATLNRN